MIAATPQRIPAIVMLPNGSAAGDRRRGNHATGSAPFAMSNAKTSRPILGPITRMTLVAPRLPDPCLRRSTPFDLPAMYAAGIDPSRYEAMIAAANSIVIRLYAAERCGAGCR